MTTITAKDISQLRKATGAGMMDCKEALNESGGDYEGALDFLRKKGQKVAAKRADRDANEGVVVTRVSDSGKEAVVLALSSETDFVAKNEEFIALANDLATLALENKPATKEDLLTLPFAGSTVSEKLTERTGTIGEKIEVSAYHHVQGDNISSYVHAGSKIGVLVVYEDGGKADASTFFRNIAMHVAAMNPSILDPSEFDADFVARETEVIQAQIKSENELNEAENLGKPIKTIPRFVSSLQLTPEVLAEVEAEIKAELKAEGKPEKIWEKIIPGKLERFVADNTLLDQERCLLSQFFVLDDSKTVGASITQFSPEAKVVKFIRVAIG
ncbi:MAG: translation elongation factor Ts [Pirellulaceae bacterium]